jgi:NAD(P)-dependent dehydrogenase (short-subunit alcohol dehydrogenase family)
MVRVSNCVFAITGAGSGIGRALALELAKRSNTLALADFDAAGLEETRRLLGNVPHFTQSFDVTTPGALGDFLAQAQRSFINNAGLSVVAPFEHLPPADFARVMDVNFHAVVEGCRVALPLLRQTLASTSPAVLPKAWLVNISSVFGLMGYPTQTAYCASKFAVKGFTETLRLELAQSDPNLDIVQVHPGGVKTNIARHAKFIRGMSADSREALMSVTRFEQTARSSPEQAASTIINGLERGRTRILIGPDARLIDYLTRLLPQSHFRWLARIMG